MASRKTKSKFKAKVLRPALNKTPSWAFVVLPKSVSKKLPRRGRTSIDGTINAEPFQATLEPDGKLSHWLKLEAKQLKAAEVKVGDVVSFEIAPVDHEPEPTVPADLKKALAKAKEAKAVWNDTTTVARVDWIHWVTSAKQSKTRAKRIDDACDMLASGKRRVCCFDPSGFYSKALSAPEEES